MLRMLYGKVFLSKKATGSEDFATTCLIPQRRGAHERR